MATVNMHEAKTHLSKLIAAIKSGEETEVIIAQNGVPAAKIIPIAALQKRPLWGAAKGKYHIPDDIDEMNDEIEKLFYGEDD